MRLKCVTCGTSIEKSSRFDPYLCRNCSQDTEGVRRYFYLDKQI